MKQQVLNIIASSNKVSSFDSLMYNMFFAIVIALYWSPSSNIEEFFYSLEELLKKIATRKKQVVIVGDINTDSLSNSLHYEQYIDLNQCYNLTRTNSEATRITIDT